MGKRWRRGPGRHAPPCYGGIRFSQSRVRGLAEPAQREGGDAGGLGRKLQAAGCGKAQPAHLTHHASEARVAQPFFHHQQHGRTGFGEHHPVRMQPGAVQGGGEQVRTHQHPQHGATLPGEQPRQKQRSGGAMLDIGALARDFVQCAGEQATARQVPVDCVHTEAQHVAPGRRSRRAMRVRNTSKATAGVGLGDIDMCSCV